MQYNYLGGGVGERAGAALGFSDAESATSRSPRLLDRAGLARVFAGGQRVDMPHARRHLAPHGILAVVEAGLGEAVEEYHIGQLGVHRQGQERKNVGKGKKVAGSV